MNIFSLNSKSEHQESDEIVEPGVPAALGLYWNIFVSFSITNYIILAMNTRSIASGSSSRSRSSQTKKPSAKSKKRSPSQKGWLFLLILNLSITSILRSSADDSVPGVKRDRPGRAKTRDEIYALYCTFGEKEHPGQDFLTKILNILRESTEGLLTHAEVNK
jgi:hypothetical protein